MGLKGKIFINPFGIPAQSVSQAERLKEEFVKLGAEIEISTAHFRAGINIDGLECTNNDLAFGVYLDKDKYFSEILENNGIRLFNSHNSIRLCDDKGRTYIHLSRYGLNLPKTLFAPLCYDKDMPIDDGIVQQIQATLRYPVIVKESYGSMGKGVFKADNKEELLAIMRALKTTPHFYQEYIGEQFGTDIRVILIGGKAVCAMKRVNKTDFRSNVALGGKGEKLDLNGEYSFQIRYAEKAAQALNLDYCGVDILLGKNNIPIICEVNSNAFFGEIECVTGVNVGKLYAEYVLQIIQNQEAR